MKDLIEKIKKRAEFDRSTSYFGLDGTQGTEKENQRLAPIIAGLLEVIEMQQKAISAIAKTKYGPELHDTNEELLDYWSRAAIHYQDQSRACKLDTESRLKELGGEL